MAQQDRLLKEPEHNMEPWIWNRMLGTVGFLCATYLPVQGYTLWKLRGGRRVLAALPLLLMIPMIIGGLQPSAYHDGSLYGMYFTCPYLPVMIYLLALCVDPRRPTACPHCGHTMHVRSFQRSRNADRCSKCGNRIVDDGSEQARPAEAASGSDPGRAPSPPAD